MVTNSDKHHFIETFIFFEFLGTSDHHKQIHHDGVLSTLPLKAKRQICSAGYKSDDFDSIIYFSIFTMADSAMKVWMDTVGDSSYRPVTHAHVASCMMCTSEAPLVWLG
jgi:hypothetical protein